MNGNTKNIIIIVLAFLVIGLVVIVGLFATNTIYVDKKSKINLKGTATKEEVTTETKEKVKLTKDQALEISSNLISILKLFCAMLKYLALIFVLIS